MTCLSAPVAVRSINRPCHAASAGGRFALVLALAGLTVPFAASAVTREPPAEARVGRGAPVEQRFLPGGLSVVTTPRGQSCVASALLDIASSTYLDRDGSVVPFDRIVRSPAASIQAVLGQPLPNEEGVAAVLEGPGSSDAAAPALAFRVQLKFSPQPGTPVALLLGSEAEPRRIELAPMLEGSTDSLLIEGEKAADLRAAFAAGEPVRLVSTSRDTGHHVTDALPSPDLAALTSCAEGLRSGADVEPLATQVSLHFEATPSPETLATPEALQACRMTPSSQPLHVGRLLFTTGFFAQTDTVFVAFDEEGRVERAYVPGILDANLTAGPEGTMQVSQASDGNVPDAANAITGCIGAHEVTACLTSEGGGLTRIAACEPLPSLTGSLPSPEGTVPGRMVPGPVFTPVPTPVQTSMLIPNLGLGQASSPITPSVFTGGGPSTIPAEPDSTPGGPSTTPGEPNSIPAEPDTIPGRPNEGNGKPSTTPGPNPEFPLPPSPVPLPAAGLLALVALGSLGLTRRRRHT